MLYHFIYSIISRLHYYLDLGNTLCVLLKYVYLAEVTDMRERILKYF